MKLLNDLYRIINCCQYKECVDYNLELNQDNFIYKAHFPNEPITPGVCIIQIALELLEEQFKRPLEIIQVKNVKFLSIISPIVSKNITYCFSKISTDELNYIKAQIVVMSDSNSPLAKISLYCK